MVVAAVSATVAVVVTMALVAAAAAPDATTSVSSTTAFAPASHAAAAGPAAPGFSGGFVIDASGAAATSVAALSAAGSAHNSSVCAASRWVPPGIEAEEVVYFLTPTPDGVIVFTTTDNGVSGQGYYFSPGPYKAYRLATDAATGALSLVWTLSLDTTHIGCPTAKYGSGFKGFKDTLWGGQLMVMAEVLDLGAADGSMLLGVIANQFGDACDAPQPPPRDPSADDDARSDPVPPDVYSYLARFELADAADAASGGSGVWAPRWVYQCAKAALGPATWPAGKGNDDEGSANGGVSGAPGKNNNVMRVTLDPAGGSTAALVTHDALVGDNAMVSSGNQAYVIDLSTGTRIGSNLIDMQCHIIEGVSFCGLLQNSFVAVAPAAAAGATTDRDSSQASESGSVALFCVLYDADENLCSLTAWDMGTTARLYNRTVPPDAPETVVTSWSTGAVDAQAGVLYALLTGFGGEGAVAFACIDTSTSEVLWAKLLPQNEGVSVGGTPVLSVDAQHVDLVDSGSLTMMRITLTKPSPTSRPTGATLGTLHVISPIVTYGDYSIFNGAGHVSGIDSNGIVWASMFVDADTDNTNMAGDSGCWDADGIGDSVAAYDPATGKQLWATEALGMVPCDAMSRGLVVSGNGVPVQMTWNGVVALGKCNKSTLEYVALVLAGVHAVLMACTTVANRVSKRTKKDLGSAGVEPSYVELSGGGGSAGTMGDGTSSARKRDPVLRLMLLLSIAGAVLLLANTIIGVIAQVDAGAQMASLTGQLADIATFRQQRLRPTSATVRPTPFNLTEMCYCTGTYWTNAQLSSGQCDWSGLAIEGQATCDDILSATSGCDAAFAAFTCPTALSPSGACQPSYTPQEGAINAGIHEAFLSCSDHYLLLQRLMWAELALHSVLALIMMPLKVLRARRPKQKKLRLSYRVMSVASHVASISLWAYAFSVYKLGQVCTDPSLSASIASGGGVGQNSITSATLLSHGVPGCQWTAGTNWPDTERKMLETVNQAVFVHLAKPVMYGVMALAGLAEGCA